MNINCYSSIAHTLSAAPACAVPTEISSHLSGFGFERPNTGNTNEWLTPQVLVQRLGPFDLDPCGCAQMRWSLATTTYVLPQHDGLSEPWFGRVWCKPPYGPNVDDWARRMAQHGNGIMLVFLRTDTATWQQDILPFADATLLPEGRLHFYLPSGERGKSGTAPSALLARTEQRGRITQCRHRRCAVP